MLATILAAGTGNGAGDAFNQLISDTITWISRLGLTAVGLGFIFLAVSSRVKWGHIMSKAAVAILGVIFVAGATVLWGVGSGIASKIG